jgi:ankyrin repeat protein
MKTDQSLFNDLVDTSVENHPAAERLLSHEPELIDFRNGLGETALHVLAVEDFPDGVKFLGKHGAFLDTKNEWGKTPLMEAAILGNEPMVGLLLELGARVDVLTYEGESVFDFVEPDSPVASLLLEYSRKAWN